MRNFHGFIVVILASTTYANAAVLTFREGLNGYVGTGDTELYSDTPALPLGANVEVSIDASNGGAISQGMLQFAGIIGNGANQIPAGSTINSATLTLQITSAGSGLNFHRMLQAWTEGTATWDSLTNGVQGDGVEAIAAATVSIGANDSNTNILSGPLVVANLTPDVQAWAAGQSNFGWALLPFMPNGTNGVDFIAKEGATVLLGFPNEGPTLTVDFTPIPEPASLSLLIATGLTLGARRRLR